MYEKLGVLAIARLRGKIRHFYAKRKRQGRKS